METTLPLFLDDDTRADLDALRAALDKRPGAPSPFPDPVFQAPADRAGRLLARLAEWLLDEEQKTMLRQQPRQCFFLQACAYLMVIGAPDAGSPWDDDALPRSTHAQILEDWRSLGIKDADQAAVMARICLEMADVSACDPGLPTNASPYSTGAPVNTGWIAAALRLSRDLDLKAAETFVSVIKHLNDRGHESSADWINAFDVDSVGPHPYIPATIRVKLRCRDAELHRALKRHERTVGERLNRINQHVRPRFLYADVIYEIEPVGYEPVDLKFSVDTSAALQLFMGNRLYADKRVFLRELIQNAVDACSLRKLNEKDYTPAISIAFNHDISRVTIRDNGIGMDRQWLEKYFLSIGISFYRSDDIQSVNRDPRIDIGFISQFGIGFLSSFIVAERIVIKTRREASPGMMITITSLKDYFDVRAPDDSLPVGTEVALHLKPSRINYCRSMEFVGYLKTNVRFLQIPVTCTDEKGHMIIIGNEPLSYAPRLSGEADFTAPIAFDDAEGHLYLGVKMHAGRIFSIESAIGGVSVFQDGIFVTQDETLLPEGARQTVIGRINLKGRDKCDLSMDRNRIFWDGGRKKAVRQLILLALAEIANQVMDHVRQQGGSGHHQTSVRNHLAIFFDFGEVDDAVHDRLCEPLQKVVDKRFRDFVRVHFAHTRSAASVPAADGYSERWQQRILASFAPKN